MRVIFPDPDVIEAAGYPTLAYCPFLLSDQGQYPDAANRYLRERALCEWLPRLRPGQNDDSDRARIEFQTSASCEAMARRLGEFLTWCLRTGQDWRTIQYSQLIGGWQAGMLSGIASRSGRQLKSTTVNGRVHEASLFLVWAEERGQRGRFLIPMKTTRIRLSTSASYGRAVREVKQRVGKVPTPHSRLILPSPKEVGQWLSQVRILKGQVKEMCCELIVSTGIRISECNQWRINTLPQRKDWLIIDGQVPCMIKFGVKGGKIMPGSLEGTKPREILVPLELAERIDYYRNFQRPTQIRRWINSGKSKSERDRRARMKQPDRLWLGERSNRPFTNSQLYQDWTGVPACPSGWHPHRGREFFAVELIVAHARNMIQASGHPGVPPMNWLIGTLACQVRIILMPLLGHVDEDTTNLYLKAARARLVMEIGHPAMRWQDFTDADE